MRRYVLLDRDGTITIDRGYLREADGLGFLPGAVEGLRALRSLGLGLLVVTNQSGVGRGYFDLNRLNQIHDRLQDNLRAKGVELDGIYACPHGPDEGCSCRKPLTGLVQQAQLDLRFDPKACIVVGDKNCDWEMGRRLRAFTIAVTPSNSQPVPEADAVARNLIEAAQHVRRWLTAMTPEASRLS